jgi:threonine synthase
MKLVSTNNKANVVDLKEAVLNSLPADRGLYMPTEIPHLKESFVANIEQFSFQEIAYEMASTLIGNYIPASDLKDIVYNAVVFPAPLVKLDDSLGILELFHGPSLAFKDFGAQFMSRLMAHFTKGEDKELLILVATSGDTGGAVAAGFHNVPGIKVAILYPSGKVSALQEKQLTTLGGNIYAFEINGTFDDCQAMVKTAFLDPELKADFNLSSANSINIARLIPQSFYYAEAYKQGKAFGDLSFIIPSGNFGNLTAGLLAKRMGLPVKHFVAATNKNKIVPDYLESGNFNPIPSVSTLSNAMDVGNPSNFARMMDLYGSTWNNIKKDISGYWYDDHQTAIALKEVYDKYNYIIDPHGAVGYCAAKEYLNGKDEFGVILETAHSSKFKPDVERILNMEIQVPHRLAILKDKKKTANYLQNSFSDFKAALIETF